MTMKQGMSIGKRHADSIFNDLKIFYTLRSLNTPEMIPMCGRKCIVKNSLHLVDYSGQPYPIFNTIPAPVSPAAQPPQSR